MKKLFFILFLIVSSTGYTQQVSEFVIPFNPGGVSDIVGRIIVKGLPAGKYVALNKPGHGSQVAVAHSKQQQTMMLSTASSVFATNLFVIKNLNYNPDQDLEIIGTVGIIPAILVCNKQSGINSISDMLNSDRPLAFGIVNLGSNDHLVTELLFDTLKKRHILVAYAGGGNQGVINLIGGHIDCMFTNFPTVKPLLGYNNLKVIMISQSINSNYPTWEEEFKKPFPIQSYLVVNVSSQLPDNLKKEYVKDLTHALTNNQTKTALEQAGIVVRTGTEPDAIKKAIDANSAIRKFIKDQKLNLSNN
jgi:tripartite-type tricarboxylate transporter receptor subunit TctC